MENEEWYVKYTPAGSSQITGEKYMDAVVEPVNILVERFPLSKKISARAELIAAAPEMLAVCEAIARLSENHGRLNMLEVAGMARAAIKAAEGK